MESQYMIGIDCGTTNVKAVVFDTCGNEILSAARENTVISQGNHMEQDMEELWQNVCSVLKEVGGALGDKKDHLTGLGISGQGEGLWALDIQGKPVRNAILWNDARTYELTASLKERSDYPKMRQILGTYFKNGSTLMLIKWFCENEPELFQKTAYFLTCKDYIRYRITGEIFWELSDASASCVNLQTKEYAYDVFEALKIPEMEKKLPPLIASCDRAGELTVQISDATGLPAGLPVSGGILDVLSACAGLGAVRPGDTCIILGTTGMTTSIMDSYEPDEQLAGWGYIIDGICLGRGIGCMAAAPNLDWIVKMLFEGENPGAVFARIEKELAGRMPGEGGLIYHPHISLAGERAPFFRPDATASFLGIRQNTSKMDMIYAVLEGVAMAIRDCLSKSGPLKTVYLSGGGSKNTVWAQMISDVLGVSVLITESSELTAKGAALSAAIMSGCINSTSEVRNRFLTVKKTYLPDMKKHAQYTELYQMYKLTQKAIEPFWAWRAERWTN
ncbi:MAG: carbohydrate kinase [Lachnospiraceae bacterium]|nr:carbohydrate kinase [Lachnospiraceae bacterium]